MIRIREIRKFPNPMKIMPYTVFVVWLSCSQDLTLKLLALMFHSSYSAIASREAHSIIADTLVAHFKVHSHTSLSHSHTHSLLVHSFIHSLTHTHHSLTHSLIHSLVHSLTHTPTHPLIHSPTFPLSLTHLPTFIHSFTDSPTHSLTHPLTHSPTHSTTYPSQHVTCTYPYSGEEKISSVIWATSVWPSPSSCIPLSIRRSTSGPIAPSIFRFMNCTNS